MNFFSQQTCNDKVEIFPQIIILYGTLVLYHIFQIVRLVFNSYQFANGKLTSLDLCRETTK